MWLESTPQEYFGYGGNYVGDLIGLEIEVEGQNLPTQLQYHWVIHNDGSLRRKNPGDICCEYVSKKPVDLLGTVKALEYLDKKFKEANAVANDSGRTSVHVHINCLDLNFRKIFTWTTLYILLEEVLMDFCGPERKGNHFCLTFQDAEYAIIALQQIIKSGDPGLFAGNQNYRYSAFNAAAIGKFGSIEFRAMKGTMDIDLIRFWTELLLSIKNASLKFGNPQQIISDFSHYGPNALISKVFTPAQIKRLSPVGLDEKMFEGMRLAQDLAYMTDWKESEKTHDPNKYPKRKPAVVERHEFNVEAGALNPLGARINQIIQNQVLPQDGRFFEPPPQAVPADDGWRNPPVEVVRNRGDRFFWNNPPGAQQAVAVDPFGLDEEDR